MIAPARYGLQHPVVKTPGPYLVIGSTVDPPALRIHLDADDPAHPFFGPEQWPGWPNAKTLSAWWNARYGRAMRLRLARATAFTLEDATRIDREAWAGSAYILTRKIVEAPEEEHSAGELDWSPSGQVWKQGARWVKVDAAEAAEGLALLTELPDMTYKRK